MQASRPRRVSESRAYSSKYGSDLSAISAMMGDLGPDLGPVALRSAAILEGGSVKVHDGRRDSGFNRHNPPHFDTGA
jgi:hypothetical protein